MKISKPHWWNKISTCTLEDKPQRFIWNNKLEKLFNETLEKELRSMEWEDFYKLQIIKMENIYFGILVKETVGKWFFIVTRLEICINFVWMLIAL